MSLPPFLSTDSREFNPVAWSEASSIPLQFSERKEDRDQETKSTLQLETITKFYKIKPYPYQVEIFQRVKTEWEQGQTQYGNIVYLETGMGKTHITIMLLNFLFHGQTYDHQEFLEPHTDEDLQQRIRTRDAELQSSRIGPRKKVFFIVPVQNLIEQQAATIERYTQLVVGRYLGRQKRSSRYYSELEAWQSEFVKHDVFVVMAKKFYDLLMHGFISMEAITLVVFDECHHTDQDHLYNLIMRDFFYHKFEPGNPECRRPHVLGLTASPIKQKIERVMAVDIESMLQNLANNLYSKFVTISSAHLPSIEKNLEIKIIEFKSKFQQNIREIEDIEASVIRPIAQMVALPEGSYKMHESLI
jgi:ERCC4-related helicase